MQVVILAGGRGTRLGSLTRKRPKVLVPIGGKPFLHYQLSWLARHGLRDVVLCVGHLGEMVEAFVGDGAGFGVRIAYAREAGALLGTAGALKNAGPLLDEQFVVLNGDSYLPINPLPAVEHFVRHGFVAMMLTFKNRDRYDRSNVLVRDGYVVVYSRHERPSGMECIDYGMQCFRKVVLDLIPPGVFCNLDVVYQTLVSRGQLAAYPVTQPFYEIGSARGLNRFRRYVERGGARVP